MSDPTAKAATPDNELRKRFMNRFIPATDEVWWARNHIAILESCPSVTTKQFKRMISKSLDAKTKHSNLTVEGMLMRIGLLTPEKWAEAMLREALGAAGISIVEARP